METMNTLLHDTFKAKIKKKKFSKTVQSPNLVCLKKMTPKSQAKIKPSFS